MSQAAEVIEGAEVGVPITDEAVADLRAMIGEEYDIPQYNTVATEDAIKHYGLGIGDDNPLWTNRDYAAASRWGTITPLPTFVMSCGYARMRGLPGVHGLFTGIDLHCHEPIKVGTPIKARTSLHDVVERQGRYAGRQFQQIYQTRYTDPEGTVLSTLYSHAFRMERKAGKQGGKYSSIERQRYTDADLAEIEAALDVEGANRRGKTPRYFEDVQVGDPVSPIVKGPLTVTDCICFLMGFGYIFVKAHRQAHEFRKRHPGAGIKDSFGVWDIPERVHWEEELAQNIGMPTMYDYGPQRLGWVDHAIHDWIGDDAWMRRLRGKLIAPNYIGDTTWIKGKVIEKNEADSSITLEMEGVDQRGRVTVVATSEVVLLRK